MENPDKAVDVAEVQRRTVRTLAVTNAVGGIGVTTGIAVASLLAADLAGTRLAGMSQTAQVAGTALAAVVLARLMSVRGRRIGLTLGYLAGAVGSVLCVVAGVVRSFPLLLGAAALFGTASATNSAARFAATDLASDEHRGRDLSSVVWATTVGAVLGPNLADPGGDLAQRLGLPRLTGAYVVTAVALLVTAAIVARRLRPDPLLLARERAARTAPDAVRVTALEAVRAEPGILASIAAIALAHTVMVSVMIMTPIHMRDGAATVRVIGLTISGHILGMFAFSPLVGRFVDRLGGRAVLLSGAAVEALACVLAALAPVGPSTVLAIALFVLGLGWSFATIGASTTLVAQTPVGARAAVQGVSDLVMGLAAALGGVLAGVVVAGRGYHVLALACMPAAALVAVAALAVRGARD